jgi:hypothetical protein
LIKLSTTSAIQVGREIRVRSPFRNSLTRSLRTREQHLIPWRKQAEQALRDDLPRLFHQFVNNLCGWLDLADQASALTR